MSFPPILLALFLVTIIGTGATRRGDRDRVGAAPGVARLAENCATSVGSREFVASARATGVGRPGSIGRYLLPNMAEPLVLAGLAYFAGRIIDISGLDFLGVGVQPPHYDWGTLLTTGVQSIYVTPWAAIAPAAMITITGIVAGVLRRGAVPGAEPPAVGTRPRRRRRGAGPPLPRRPRMSRRRSAAGPAAERDDVRDRGRRDDVGAAWSRSCGSRCRRRRAAATWSTWVSLDGCGPARCSGSSARPAAARR